MLPLHKYLMIWSVLLATSGCSLLQPQKEVVVETKIIERNIPLQARPKPLKLNSIVWRVVTQDNLQEFLDSYKDSSIVFFALTVQDYEALAINMSDIKRYIEQQKAIIIYYETAITPNSKKEPINESK